MRAALVLVCLSAAVASAGERGTVMTRSYALILGGGKAKADADGVLAKFSAPKGLAPAAGYPKVVKSDAVKGLKPGFFVAVLGYCDSTGELSSAVRTMWAAQKGSYAREVSEAVPGACPKLQGPAPGPSDEETKLQKKAEALADEADFEKARKVYLELLTLNPGSKDAQAGLERIMVLTTD